MNTARTPMTYTPRFFDGGNVFESTEWRRSPVEIKEGDRVVYSHPGIEHPESWSQRAVNVVASKYLYGGDRDEYREDSVRQLVGRVAKSVGYWATTDGYFDGESVVYFARDLAWLLIHQYVSFNSPVWFNVGLHGKPGVNGKAENYRWSKTGNRVMPCEDSYLYPQCSACFIQRVDDDMASIMALAVSEGMLFKGGSGTGTDLSTLRSTKERLSGGGRPSGPVSFMRIYDAVASVVKSGGKCLAPHQGVFTATGVRTAEELGKSGEKFIVLSWSRRLGRYAAKTAQAWPSGRKTVVRVTTDKGSFEVSSDHPFMLRTGEARRADSLKPGQSLMPCVTSESGGYVRVGLMDGRKGRDLLHRMVALDVMGIDTVGRVIHHGPKGKLDNSPANLSPLNSQSEHAGIHARESVENGSHVFQTRSFEKSGEANGMHAASGFWRDEEKSSAYREKQGDILRQSGRAAVMQNQSMRSRMLNMGYRLINAGHNIETFAGYLAARKAEGCRVSTGEGKKAAAIDNHFGSYKDFYRELRDNNHRVISVESIGDSPVYSVEVFDDEPDDKRDWSEHNYVIAPIGSDPHFINGCVSLNTRRAAKMQTLKCYHPDIMSFIHCKANEERKAAVLAKAGYSVGIDGDASGSVNFQNANLTVRVTNKLLSLASQGSDCGPNWDLRAVTSGDVIETINASEMLDAIALDSWACGDPGVQFEDTIQGWNTLADTEPINSSNPCGEFMHIDDSACNLASINLDKFRRTDGTFDVDSFRAVVRIFIIAQDILVDRSSYPTERIALNSHKYRPLGLGHANGGGMLMTMGIPYDSDEGRSMIGAITAIMGAEAYLASSEIANHLGAFEGYRDNANSFAHVMQKHLDESASAKNKHSEEFGDDGTHKLWDIATDLWWSVRDRSDDNTSGFRNSQTTLLAPTGTIAFMMDCDTTGIEPFTGLIETKRLAGGGTIVKRPRCISDALTNATDGSLSPGDKDHTAALKWIDEHGTIVGFDASVGGGYFESHPDGERRLSVFDCAFPATPDGRCLSVESHLLMMSACQPFLSGAISKTINMPSHSTPSDIRNAITFGHSLGLKSLAIYRNESKGAQPVTVTRTELTPEFIAAAYIESDTEIGMGPVAEDAGEFIGDRFGLGMLNDLIDQLQLVRKDGDMGPEETLHRIIEENRDHSRMSDKGHDTISKLKAYEFIHMLLEPDRLQTDGDILDTLNRVLVERDGIVQADRKYGGALHRLEYIEELLESARIEGEQSTMFTLRRLVSDASLCAKIVEFNPSPVAPKRDRLPNTRESLTHKFCVDGHEGYVTVGLFPDRRPGEVFITMAKEGSTVGGLMDAVGTMLSLGLQYGIPLDVLCRKLARTKYSPQGRTINPRIRTASSLTDYIARWLIGEYATDHAGEFGVETAEKSDPVTRQEKSILIGDRSISDVSPEKLDLYKEFAFSNGSAVNILTALKPGEKGPATAHLPRHSGPVGIGPVCDYCGGMTQPSGNCHTCTSCGKSMGCS